MRSVWKFPLRVTEVQVVTMPRAAKILSVAMQHGVPTLWAWVDPHAPTEERLIGLVGTGHLAPYPDEADYLGTVFDGPLVWHVFAQVG